MTERVPNAVGMVTFADSQKFRDALRAPFPPELIGKIPKGGQKLDFVGHAAVTDRLLKEAPDYTFHIDTVAETPDRLHVIGILATMTIGGKSIQEAGAVDRQSSWGEELKLAISDFIRRGAMRFGVALDLWSKEDLQAAPSRPGELAGDHIDAELKNAPDWETVEQNIKASGGSGNGEVLGSPESSGARDNPPVSGQASDLEGAGLGPQPPAPSSNLASNDLWAEAISLDLTKARVLTALRQAGVEVTSASEITAEQLESVLVPLRKLAKR